MAPFIRGSASDDYLSEIGDFKDENRGRAGMERTVPCQHLVLAIVKYLKNIATLPNCLWLGSSLERPRAHLPRFFLMVFSPFPIYKKFVQCFHPSFSKSTFNILPSQSELWNTSLCSTIKLIHWSRSPIDFWVLCGKPVKKDKNEFILNWSFSFFITTIKLSRNWSYS